jgi:DeoR/GlpR family transcriptional regulator of sugar metabolism
LDVRGHGGRICRGMRRRRKHGRGAGGLGACGIDAAGPSSGHADAAAIKRAMLERAEETVMVLDHTKFGSRHAHAICAMAEIDHLLCDARPEGAFGRALLRANVDVLSLAV